MTANTDRIRMLNDELRQHLFSLTESENGLIQKVAGEVL
jgi:hypothetical protein